MKIIAAPDAFKGSLTAREACEAMARAAKNVFPSARIIRMPAADGGEGTLDVLLSAGGSRRQTTVRGPLGTAAAADIGIIGDTAVIELAQASGLLLIAQQDADPMKTSTYGTGELIRFALDLGFRKLIVALGGSATNDGGTGMLEALGVRFFDKSSKRLHMNGAALAKIAEIDVSALDPRLKETEIRIASDVDNPFIGKNGASYVFGPQKGADEECLRLLEEGMRHFADLTCEITAVRLHGRAGAGAAGGSAGALIAYCGAELASGISTVLEVIRFEEALENADFILTGEGRTDQQTLYGKALSGIAALAKKHHVPVHVISGSVDRSAAVELRQTFASLSELDDGRPLEQLMKCAADLLETETEKLLKTLKESGRNS